MFGSAAAHGHACLNRGRKLKTLILRVPQRPHLCMNTHASVVHICRSFPTRVMPLSRWDAQAASRSQGALYTQSIAQDPSHDVSKAPKKPSRPACLLLGS